MGQCSGQIVIERLRFETARMQLQGYMPWNVVITWYGIVNDLRHCQQTSQQPLKKHRGLLLFGDFIWWFSSLDEYIISIWYSLGVDYKKYFEFLRWGWKAMRSMRRKKDIFVIEIWNLKGSVIFYRKIKFLCGNKF